MGTASDLGRESPAIWDFRRGRLEQKWPLQLHVPGKALLSLSQAPAPPLPPPSNPEHQDLPCLETLSHPLIPNYLLPLSYAHLIWGGGGDSVK